MRNSKGKKELQTTKTDRISSLKKTTKKRKEKTHTLSQHRYLRLDTWSTTNSCCGGFDTPGIARHQSIPFQRSIPASAVFVCSALLHCPPEKKADVACHTAPWVMTWPERHVTSPRPGKHGAVRWWWWGGGGGRRGRRRRWWWWWW